MSDAEQFPRDTPQQSATDSVPRRDVVKWPAIGLVVLIVAGIGVWYARASSAYEAEQQAINELSSRFPPDRVLILDADAEPVDDYAPEDVDMVITVAWGGAQWMRGVVGAVGEPILRRVQTIKIYDPNLNDRVIDSLVKLKSLEEVRMAPEPGISRSAFGVMLRALPNAIVYFEHDDDDYDRPRDNEEEWDEEEENEDWDEDGEDPSDDE